MKIMEGLLALGCALTLTTRATTSAPTSAGAAAPAQTQAGVTPPAPDGQRFLFIVDTSASMRKIDAAARQALFDLIYFGIDGQMKKGDTLGLWTFNEQTYAGQVPMQVWDPDQVLSLASLAAKHLQAQKFEGKSHPQSALARVGKIIQNVKELNVLMLTDGATQLEGTAFDHQVNPVLQQRRREAEKMRKPFIVGFIARGGQVTNAFVTLAGQPILIPPPSPPPPRQVVLRPKTKGTNVARATPRLPIRRTNSTPLIVRPAASPTQVAAPSSHVSPGSLTTQDTPPEHPADFIGSNEALRAPVSAPVAAAVTAPFASPPTVSAAVGNAASPQPPRDPKRDASASTNVPPGALAQGVANLLPATPVAARGPGGLASAGAGSGREFSPRRSMVMGLLLLGGGMALLLLGFHRARSHPPRPSFITQSMERR